MITIQVTIGSSATPATTLDLYASTLVMTCSGTADYFGGPTVSTTNGIKLSSTTPIVVATASPHGIALKNLYFAGTASDTVNIAYEPAQ